MGTKETPYGDTEYQLMLEKLDGFCGKLSNQMLFEELSKEARLFSEEHSTNLWNQESSKRFIKYVLDKWDHSYCAILAVESVVQELTRSYPQTTFTHISQKISKLPF